MITFVRRIRMRNGYFDEAIELLRQRVDYMRQQHGVQLEMHIRFGGPTGEVALLSRHQDATALELFRQKIMADQGSSKLLRKISEVTLAGETHDEIWMEM